MDEYKQLAKKLRKIFELLGFVAMDYFSTVSARKRDYTLRIEIDLRAKQIEILRAIVFLDEEMLPFRVNSDALHGFFIGFVEILNYDEHNALYELYYIWDVPRDIQKILQVLFQNL